MDKNIKLSEILEEYINNKKEENYKNNSNKIINNSQKSQSSKSNSSIYVGKEEFGEENAFINELNSTYYKDIMSLNKINDYHGNYNSTCILIQLLQKEKLNKSIPENNNEISPPNEIKNEENPKGNENKDNEYSNNIKENKENKEENKKNIEQNNIEKVDKKEEEKKNENNSLE